jgi:hypothetical protein
MNDLETNAERVRKGESPMKEDLVALLRYRVATRYYEQPQVIDRLARALIEGRHVEP